VSRQVTKEEFDSHIRAWPRTLEFNIYGAHEPPLATFNDFTLGNWPESVVASYNKDDWLDDDGNEVPPRDTGWRIWRELPDEGAK
jgi:hypothetical protein